VIAQCKRQHRSTDFVAFLREIDKAVAAELEIHVIVDNLSAHKSPVVARWLARNPRFHIHFTPTYASWLNLVERFFGLLTAEGSGAAPTRASRNYGPRSAPTSTHTIRRGSPSRGLKPPTRSSKRCAASDSAPRRRIPTFFKKPRIQGLAHGVRSGVT
jgi:transposase